MDELLNKMNGLIQDIKLFQDEVDLMMNQKFRKRFEKYSKTKAKKKEERSSLRSWASGKTLEMPVKKKKPSKPNNRKNP